MSKRNTTLAIRRPSLKAQESEAQTIAEGKPMRISIRVSPTTHKQLKLAATEAGLSIKGYVLALLREQGIDAT